MESCVPKHQNPDKEYPSNIGQKWTDAEEALLLDSLKNNTDIELIAKTHNRTVGGIYARRREIAYKMYTSNVSTEEIVEKTTLPKEQLIELIKTRQSIHKKHKSPTTSTSSTKKTLSAKDELAEIKNDIKDIKRTINELVDMMKAVYDFEEA